MRAELIDGFENLWKRTQCMEGWNYALWKRTQPRSTSRGEVGGTAERRNKPNGRNPMIPTAGFRMITRAAFALGLIVAGSAPAPGQDIVGIEDCTKAAGLDKRTGCLQSNVNFLQQLVTKNALEAR